MQISIWEKIANIPWWVYLTVFYVFFKQCTMLKSRMVEITNVVIPLLVFISVFIALLTLQLMLHPKLIHYQTNLYLMSSAISGIACGWLFSKISGMEVIQQTKKIHLPGSWVSFIISTAGLIALLLLNQRYGVTWLTPLDALLWCTFLIGMAGGRLVALSLALRHA